MNGKMTLFLVLLAVSAGFMMGRAMAAETFADDFNRADVTGTTNIGPGWLTATNNGLNPPVNMDRWNITSGRLQRYDGGGMIYCTNVSLSGRNIWNMSVKFQAASVFSHAFTLIGNMRYGANSSSWVGALFQPNISGTKERLMLRVVEPSGTMHDYPWAYADCPEADVYTMTLMRSNEFARATLSSVSTNMDTGWVSSFVRTVPNEGYCVLSADNDYYMDDFAMSADTMNLPDPNTFADDFNREDTLWNMSLGPGWLDGTQAAPPYTNRFSIVTARATQGDNGEAYATNISLQAARMYTVSADVMMPNGPAGYFWLFGNKTYMDTANYLQALWMPTIPQIVPRLVENGNMHDLPSLLNCAGVAGAWYRFTLSRSNNAMRITMTGTSVNVDSGWLTNYVDRVTKQGYAGVGSALSDCYFDNFSIWRSSTPKGVILFFK